MKCPFCGTEMLEGYLICGGAIWSTNKKKLSAKPGTNGKYALALREPLVTPNAVDSFCCPNCKQIIIDASGYPSSL